MTRRNFTAALAASSAVAANFPRPAPEFNITMMDGSLLRVSQLKGKPALLGFVLTY